MKMTKSYLDEKIDAITYNLDFPDEVEKRYKKIIKEDRELAKLIYDCLVENGVNLYDDLAEEEFKRKIKKEYEYVNAIYEGIVDII